MKKIITVSIAVVLSLLMAACGRNSGSGTAASSDSAAQTTPTVITAEATPDTVMENDTKPADTPGSMIIAESSNTISDAEKQEILDNLMAEIDGVLGNIDSLEDLDDSDLGTDNLN